jgi:hypothetical protein
LYFVIFLLFLSARTHTHWALRLTAAEVARMHGARSQVVYTTRSKNRLAEEERLFIDSQAANQ